MLQNTVKNDNSAQRVSLSTGDGEEVRGIQELLSVDKRQREEPSNTMAYGTLARLWPHQHHL